MKKLLLIGVALSILQFSLYGMGSMDELDWSDEEGSGVTLTKFGSGGTKPVETVGVVFDARVGKLLSSEVALDSFSSDLPKWMQVIALQAGKQWIYAQCMGVPSNKSSSKAGGMYTIFDGERYHSVSLQQIRKILEASAK